MLSVVRIRLICTRSSTVTARVRNWDARFSEIGPVNVVVVGVGTYVVVD